MTAVDVARYLELAQAFEDNGEMAGVGIGNLAVGGLVMGMTIALRDPDTAREWLEFTDRLVASLGGEIAEQQEVTRLAAARDVAALIRSGRR